MENSWASYYEQGFHVHKYHSAASAVYWEVFVILSMHSRGSCSAPPCPVGHPYILTAEAVHAPPRSGDSGSDICGAYMRFWSSASERRLHFYAKKLLCIAFHFNIFINLLALIKSMDLADAPGDIRGWYSNANNSSRYGIHSQRRKLIPRLSAQSLFCISHPMSPLQA